MEIDDNFRSFPTPKENPPMAVCPFDGEPLVMTFEIKGAEFICMVCKKLFGWLAPLAKPVTPELNARYEELLAQYEAEFEERKKAT